MKGWLAGFGSGHGAGIQLLFIDPDRHCCALVRFVKMGEASMRKPPTATDVATGDRGLAYHFRVHLNGTSRACRLRPDGHPSATAYPLLERQVIFHEAIHFSRIEPQPMAGGADIEIGTLGRREPDQVVLAIETFHRERYLQTVARFERLSM